MKTKPIMAISSAVMIAAGEDGDEKKGPAKFSATFYTGGAVNINGYDLPVVLDLAGIQPSKILVANLDHDSTKRVGNFDVMNDGKSLVALGTASAKTAARDEVVGSAAEGYQWQASFEVKPQKIETVKAGRTVTVNGQQIAGPVYVTRQGILKGFAFVSHGADDNTSATIAASAASTKEIKMKAEVKEWIEKRFPTVASNIPEMTAEEVENWEADFEGREGQRKESSQKASGDSISRELLDAQRRDQIESINANFLSGMRAELKSAEFLNGIKTLRQEAIDGGWTPDKYETELIRRTVPLAQTVRAPKDRKALNDDILTAALCQSGGLNDIDKHFSDEVLQRAKDRFKEGIGLNELLILAARDRGYQHDGYRANLDVQRAAFGQLPSMYASGFSTISLPGILGDSAYKFLLEGWGGGEMAWENVTDITSVRDFKTITQYKLSGSLKYEKVGPTGELFHGQVSEGSYTVKADTYGKMFAITREHIINDDLSALSQVPRELGYGANDAFNEVFWTEWLSGDGGFFAYTSAGVMSSSAALATIAAAEAAFFALTKPNGTPLGVTPNVMLVPNGSYRVSQSAMAAPVVTGGSSTVPVTNTFQGEYKVVRSAFLSNSAYSGYSAVKWYLCVVRPGFAPIQTAFLNGQRAPMIESASADFNTLGIQMRGVHDFGVNLFEARAAVQGSGA